MTALKQHMRYWPLTTPVCLKMHLIKSGISYQSFPIAINKMEERQEYPAASIIQPVKEIGKQPAKKLMCFIPTGRYIG